MLYTVRPSFFSSSRMAAMILAAMASATISGCPTLMLSDVICIFPPCLWGFVRLSCRLCFRRKIKTYLFNRVRSVSQLLIAFRRRDHAARDDELEGLLDGHLEGSDAVFRDHHVVTRRGVRGGGDEDVDAAAAGFFPQLAGCGSRHEGYRVETLPGKLDE